MDIKKIFEAAYNLGEYDAMYNDPSDKWTFERWKETDDYKQLVKESDSLPCVSTRFTIKPLEWTGKIEEEYDSLYSNTPFGNYYITMHESGRLTWRYCFDEYYDEETFEVDSIDEAKEAALKHWTDRIKPALNVC